jgi:hypothetical protein
LLDREAYETKPEDFPTGVKFSYEQTTGTSGLRKHIKNIHLELYKRLCAEHKIEPSETVVGKQTAVEAPTLPTVREPFTKDSLLCYIRNFVIADDQVSCTLNSKSFNLTFFSLLMLLNAQSFAACCSSYEKIFRTMTFTDAASSASPLWRRGTVITSF